MFGNSSFHKWLECICDRWPWYVGISGLGVRRQAATARSTGEAEVVAGADCVQSTFPIASVLEEFECQQLPFQLCTDSNSARTAFVNGYSRKLRYIKKNQRICLGFVSDSLERTGGEAVRVDSGDNTDDMHTRNLCQELLLPNFEMKWA